MSYYDKIAKQWHAITGYSGGSFKRLILNDIIISQMQSIQDKCILELGAGNGYLMKMLLMQFSSQIPSKIIISDVSEKQLEIAQKHFWISDAEYEVVDIYKKFPIASESVDIILSVMVYNEVTDRGLRNGIKESNRILRNNGIIITIVLHPDFINKQIKREIIKNNKMITSKGIKIPVIKRSLGKYKGVFETEHFKSEYQDIYGNEKLYNEKPALGKIKEVPIALVIKSVK